MNTFNFCELTDRALLNITGKDATSFLQALITCDVETLKTGDITFGALLSPQGKILFDFFIIKSVDGFMFDIDKSMADSFTHRIQFYKMRADVVVSKANENTLVFATWGDCLIEAQEAGLDALLVNDPRLPEMGLRVYINFPPKQAKIHPLGNYTKHRLKFGMPSGGLDFIFGTAFAHEALMDQFAGVDFSKGCFVGQEVVSRMQHRGSARKRFVSVSSEVDLPENGTEIMAEGKVVGTLTSHFEKSGIALVRLDRVANSVAQNLTIMAGTTKISLKLQDWVSYDWG
ncbi:MAG: folate-binding protein YgfZ [Nitratireductor sp.]